VPILLVVSRGSAAPRTDQVVNTGGDRYSNAGSKRWQTVAFSGTSRKRIAISERAEPIC
jgi:hypothetical protein